MKWEEFLQQYGEYPIIKPEMIYAGRSNPNTLQVQLSRWVADGRLVKLARGKYAIGKTYRKVEAPVEYIANWLVYPSYVSLDYGLAHYSLIPEVASVVTSVTTRTPRTYENECGTFRYRHIKSDLFWGYRTITLQGLECVLAYPEKALLDLFHFWTGLATDDRIEEMRFQNLDRIDPERLCSFVRRAESKKLLKSTEAFLRYRERFLEAYRLT
ncbi:MAG: hypothetical protein ACE5JP_17915 [Candidatus Bipolaricaulia bacterium]